MNATKRVLVYGGKGALGSTCVDTFKAQKWWVASVDTKLNENADFSLVVNPADPVESQESHLLKEVGSVLDGAKLDAVICVAGGWVGGNALSKGFVKSCEIAWKQSVIPSVIASSIAVRHLNPTGFLLLPGSAASLGTTPGMLGYGMAKGAVHYLTKSLAADGSGLPEKAAVAALCPEILNTPMNRKSMPNADQSNWTSLQFVAELILKWSNDENRPKSGNLIQIITKNNENEVSTVLQ